MKNQEINKKSIDLLMHTFYNKVRNDKTGLGDIFNNIISTTDSEWNKHKEKISNFWQRMMLGEGNYTGQPIKKHIELPEFPQEFFHTWLTLFEKSLNEVFEQEVGAPFLQRAHMIARRFQSVMYSH